MLSCLKNDSVLFCMHVVLSETNAIFSQTLVETSGSLPKKHRNPLKLEAILCVNMLIFRCQKKMTQSESLLQNKVAQPGGCQQGFTLFLMSQYS